MATQYQVIKSDIGNKLAEGQTVTPYYEDSNEIILAGGTVDHHIRKNGQYFTEHLQPTGGK